MSWVTIVILVYLFLGAISGYRRGLMVVAFSLAGYLVGVLLAMHYKTAATQELLAVLPVHQWIAQIVPAPAKQVAGTTQQAYQLAQQLAGILVFLVIVGLTEYVGRLIGQFFTRFARALKITDSLNAVGGMAIGVVEHAALVALILTLMMGFPLIHQSPLGHLIQKNSMTTQMVAWFSHLNKSGNGWWL